MDDKINIQYQNIPYIVVINNIIKLALAMVTH